MEHWGNQRGNQKTPRDKWQWKHDGPKPLEHSKSSSKREVYSNTILPEETRTIPNKQPNLTPKTMKERRTNKTMKERKTKKLVEGKKSKDQSRNKWNRNKENNSKDQ